MQVTFQGSPLHVNGTQLQKGDKAPVFSAVTQNLEAWSLADLKGIKIISVVPSLDTGVCQIQTKKFNKEATTLSDTTIITISLDLPFAQQRWCGAENITNLVILSDYQNREFAEKYSLLIDELKLLSRAVLVLDAENNVHYVEYLKEITEEPNYDAALAAAKELL